jgi:hypothetical protein
VDFLIQYGPLDLKSTFRSSLNCLMSSVNKSQTLGIGHYNMEKSYEIILFLKKNSAHFIQSELGLIFLAFITQNMTKRECLKLVG